MTAFCEFSYDELVGWLRDHDLKTGHAQTLWRNFYRHGQSGSGSESSVPERVRSCLDSQLDWTPALQVEKVLESRDGSRKFLLRSHDEQLVETVFIPQGNRRTLCLSSQLGCPWACRFCATGAMGLRRNLSAGEIVAQVLAVQTALGEKITNLVFMGMGEPLSNLDNLYKSLSILSHPLGMAVPPRRITISTIGILPGLETFIRNRLPYPLAVSLHHHDSGLRQELMPGSAAHPLPALLETLQRYTLEMKRPVFLEYLLIGAVNDSAHDARALLELVGQLNCRINLIHFHPHGDAPFIASTRQQENEFYRLIQESGIPVIFRKSRGLDIQAACGQLAGRRV